MREPDSQLTGRVGRASREEISAFLGEPEVKDSIGQSEVWIYQFQDAGASGRIPAPLQEIINYFDEVIMTFDGGGILQKYTLVLFGHGSKKGRK